MNWFSRLRSGGKKSTQPPPKHRTRPQSWRPTLEALEDRCTPTAGLTSSTFNFNNTPIAAGSTLWFSSTFQAHGLGQGPVTLQFTDQTIAFTSNGTNYSVTVPDATVVLSSSTTVATTTYNAGTNEWLSTDPIKSGGNLFFSGAELSVPNGLPGNVTGVTWQGEMQSDTANVQVQWQWGTAAYSSFSSDYTTLNVKPCDDGHASTYQNGDHAGTPETYTGSLTGGATGNGHGNNFTGNSSSNTQLTPNFLQGSGAASSNMVYISGNSSQYPYASSNPLTSVVFNESDVLTGAAMNLTNGTFDVWYTDEHALTLGVNQVTVIAANGTSTTASYPVSALNGNPGNAANPSVGAPNSTDPAGRPLSPSLYITDITNNPSSTSGDWQFGGTAIAPNAVFGTWKSYTKTIDNSHGGAITLSGANDPSQNQWNLGSGSDTPLAGLRTEGYTAEVRWNLSTLQSQGLLLPGHNYRFYVMVHDGDQNKNGGDVGQASYSLIAPIAAPVTASVSGFVYSDLGTGSAPTGLGGVTLTLTGMTATGQQITPVTVTTNADGSYSFGNLLPGTYTVTETLPYHFTPESVSAGTDNGRTDGSTDSSLLDISNITLNAGDAGINYNFTNLKQIMV